MKSYKVFIILLCEIIHTSCKTASTRIQNTSSTDPRYWRQSAIFLTDAYAKNLNLPNVRIADISHGCLIMHVPKSKTEDLAALQRSIMAIVPLELIDQLYIPLKKQRLHLRKKICQDEKAKQIERLLDKHQHYFSYCSTNLSITQKVERKGWPSTSILQMKLYEPLQEGGWNQHVFSLPINQIEKLSQ